MPPGSSVQIATDLADRITRLFDDVGASQIERYSALDVARALIPLSEASISAALSPSPSGHEAPPESP
jgi:hypothetical protein